MSKRDGDEKKAPDDALSGLLKSRLARVPNANSGGLAAMSIGLTLGGCVALGYFAGAWLDGRFKTGFWMPVGVFVGMAAGFREMFATLKKLSAQTKWPTSQPKNTVETADRVLEIADSTPENVETERNRPRIFQVPAPPISSFDAASFDTAKSARSKEQTDKLDTQRLTEKLLHDEANDN